MRGPPRVLNPLVGRRIQELGDLDTILELVPIAPCASLAGVGASVIDS